MTTAAAIEYRRPWLYAKQRDAIFHDRRYGIVEASTKSGKTVGCLIWLGEQAMAGAPGQNYWWVAPTFWNAVRGDELPIGVSMVVFDCAVNLGPMRAIRFLQLAANAVVDGVFGPKTMAAVAHKSARDLMTDITARRCLHYAGRDNDAFLWGWLRRACDILARATER